MAPVWRAMAVTLIAHVLVCVSLLPSVGCTLMAPAWRDISRFGGRLAAQPFSFPHRRYLDRSRNDSQCL